LRKNKIKVLEKRIEELEEKRELQEKANIHVSNILSDFGKDYSQRVENHREVLLDINNSLICLCEVLGSKWDNPIDAIPQLLEWAYAEKRFLMLNNKKLGLEDYERPSCLICRKTFQDYYCPNCHENTFHKAHISLLQGYMKHDDPLKEIKKILYGEHGDSKEYVLNKARLDRFKLGMSEEEYNKYINYTNLNYEWQLRYKEIINTRKTEKPTCNEEVDCKDCSLDCEEPPK